MIWEAAKAGVSRVHIVLSEFKSDILENSLTSVSRFADTVRPDLPRIAIDPNENPIGIYIHIQETAGGVGDAIATAMHDISGYFLVLLGDNILMNRHNSPELSGADFGSEASLELVRKFEENGIPCAGLLPVSDDDLGKYGVVSLDGGLVKEIIEKPKKGAAPSNLILCGRYLLPPRTGEILSELPKEKYGEMQSIEMLNQIIINEGLESVNLDDYVMYDSGDPISWLKSQVDHALNRDDLKEEFESWLNRRIEK